MIRELNSFIGESVSILDSRRNELEEERQIIYDFIKEKVIGSLSSKNIIIQGRVKSSDSLREKVIRKNYYQEYNSNPSNFINKLPDLIGIRLVCLLNDDEQVLVNDLRKLFNKKSEVFSGFYCIEESDECNLYIEFKEKPDLQKNKNPIFKFSCKWLHNQKEFNIEIQIKSLIHMFWGELEHMLIYKNYNYLLDSSFYDNIMNSTYKLLKNVDNQLSVIQNHLQTNDPSKQLKEVKEMLAKILHKNIHKKIEICMDCKIDLRMVYDSIIHILFYEEVDSRNIFERASQYITKSLQFEIVESDLEMNEKNLVMPRLNGHADGIKELCIALDKLIKSEDVFWRIFYCILSKLESKADYTDELIYLSGRIVDSYRRKYIEEISIDDSQGASSYFIKSIIISIVRSFEYIGKVEFLVSHENVVRLTSDFIQTYQETIEELLPEERNIEVLNYITDMLSSLIILGQENNIEASYLINIKENIMNEEIKWQPIIFHKEKIEDFVNGGLIAPEIIFKVLQGERLGGENND